MKRLVLYLLLLAGCTAKTPPTTPYDVVITHANVVDVETGTLRPNQTVAITGDQIRLVEKTSKALPARQTLDAAGQYLIPGLWDMHVHFRGGEALAEENKRLLPLYLYHGITTVRDAGGDLTSHIFRWRQQLAAGTLAGPRIFTSGPKIDGPQAYWPGSLEVETPAQISRALDSLQKLHVDYVKIYDSKISPDAFLGAIAEAEKRGLKTTGHMPYSVKLSEAVDRGLDASEHLYYVFKATSSKEDSLTALVRASQSTARPLGLFDLLPAIYATQSPEAAQRIYQQLARHHTAVVPTLFIQQTLADLAATDHTQDSLLAFIGPGIQATYARRTSSARRQSAEAAAFSQKLNARFRAMVPELYNAGVAVLAGSDSGPFNSYVYPGASLQGELQALVAAGLTPAQVLRIATLGGAQFMGVEKQTGTIAVGKQADVVLLTANPLTDIAHADRVATVVVRGRVYSKKELQALLASVRNK